MIKKISFSFLSLVILLFLLAPSLLGFSLFRLGDAITVATSMSAKLACSAKYISGFSDAQIIEDLASYSPANRLVNIQYSNANKTVNTALLGLAKTSATYRSGLGCTLNIGDTSQLDKVKIISSTKNLSTDEWPIGSKSSFTDVIVQRQLNNILTLDNKKGLNTRALVVVKDGHIIAEAYAKDISQNTPLLGWSMGKSLTSIMLGRLEQMGKINENNSHLFPQWQDERKNITLKNLLQMSSGLDFDETYAPGTDATRMLFNSHTASDLPLQSPLKHQPSEYFSYSSGTTNLLSRYIHIQLGNSTQKSMNFLKEQILTPLGMNNTIFEVDPSGIFVGSSYIYASGRDWARLGLLMLNKGAINHQQLLSQQWIKHTATPNESINDKRYGYQFWLNAGENTLRWPSLPKDAYAMLGNRKQSVMIIPSKNVVLVRLGWTKHDYPLDKNNAKILKAIN